VRQSHERKCGPINDPQLHANRVASFDQLGARRCRTAAAAALRLSRSQFSVGTSTVTADGFRVRRSANSTDKEPSSEERMDLILIILVLLLLFGSVSAIPVGDMVAALVSAVFC
jgi:hypothetical protein